jgi:hypothetical protein
MGWLYGQTWLAYLLAFAVGVLLAWALLVRPAQRRLRAATGRAATGAGSDSDVGSGVGVGVGSDADTVRTPVAAAAGPAPRPAPAPAPRPAPPVAEARTEVLPAVDPALSTLDHRLGTTGVGAAGAAALGAAGVAARGPRPGTDPATGSDNDTDTGRIPVVVPGAFPGSARPLPDGAAPAPEYTIKGSARSMLYHTPASPHYDRTTAEVWFTSSRDAEAAGFADVRGPGR